MKQLTLRRSRDGRILASCLVDEDAQTMTFTIDESIKVNSLMPPFQSFFIDRIMKSYFNHDVELSDVCINWKFENDLNGNLTKVIVKDYGKDSFGATRSSEIINTLQWALGRMLDRKEGH